MRMATTLAALVIGLGGRTLSDQEKQALDAQMKELRTSAASLAALSLSDDERTDRLMKAEIAEKELLEQAVERPEVMAYLRPELQKLPKGAESKDVRARMVAILARDPDASSLKICAGLLDQEPDLFDDGLLVSFAERGVKKAEPLLRALVAKSEFDFGQIYPAVYFGLRGDGVGRKVLEHVTGDADLSASNPDAGAACAAALAQLGDATAWKRCVAAQLAELRKLPKADEAAWRFNVTWTVLRLEYFKQAIDQHKPVSVACMSWPLDAYIEAHASEFATIADGEARIAALQG